MINIYPAESQQVCAIQGRRRLYLLVESPEESTAESTASIPHIYFSFDDAGSIKFSSESAQIKLGIKTTISVQELGYYDRLVSQKATELWDVHYACGFDPESQDIARFLNMPLVTIQNKFLGVGSSNHSTSKTRG